MLYDLNVCDAYVIFACVTERTVYVCNCNLYWHPFKEEQLKKITYFSRSFYLGHLYSPFLQQTWDPKSAVDRIEVCTLDSPSHLSFPRYDDWMNYKYYLATLD